MIDTMDIKKGIYVMYKGEICTIVDFQHVKPGKGNAFTRTKMKSLKTGLIFENTFKSGEKLEDIFLEKQKMEYLYKEGDFYVCMNTETYEQINIPAELFGESAKYLKENTEIMVKFYKDEPVDVELPNFINLEVVETSPGEKGNTVTGGSKPAKLETGAVVNVPMFINEGEIIRVDTRTNTYIERVKN